MNLATLWAQSDGLGRGVMLLLLAMSVLTWMVIVYKAWLLARARRSIEGGLAGYWRAADSAGAEQALQQADRLHLLWPLHGALGALPEQPGVRSGTDGVQAPSAARQAHLTRLLRDGLQQSTRQLQWGQILLATVGSTAPFVGLLGTVWGIMHSFTSIAQAKDTSLAVVAPGIAEALFATAIGLAAAIPAVIGYNQIAVSLGRFGERAGAAIAGLAKHLSQTPAKQPAKAA